MKFFKVKIKKILFLFFLFGCGFLHVFPMQEEAGFYDDEARLAELFLAQYEHGSDLETFNKLIFEEYDLLRIVEQRRHRQQLEQDGKVEELKQEEETEVHKTLPVEETTLKEKLSVDNIIRKKPFFSCPFKRCKSYFIKSSDLCSHMINKHNKCSYSKEKAKFIIEALKKSGYLTD